MIYVDGEYYAHIDEACPECGSSPITVGDACHTYSVDYRDGNGPKWMSCMNCGSAGWLHCRNEECNWSYDWGLNPDNPRAEGNEKYRPSWLVGKWPY